MENATKALLIAASMLIGIMVVSIAVYLFATFGAQAKETSEQRKIQQLNDFNEQFTSYVGKEGTTIYDVISVANLATDNNRYYDLPGPATGKDNYISVYLDKEPIEGKSTDAYNKLIQQTLANGLNAEGEKLTEYSCKAFISDVTGRVYSVEFDQKE